MIGYYSIPCHQAKNLTPCYLKGDIMTAITHAREAKRKDGQIICYPIAAVKIPQRSAGEHQHQRFCNKRHRHRI